MSHAAETGAAPSASAGRIAAGLAAAVLAAVVANAVIAVLALAAGASDGFLPLQASSYIALTVIGVLAGAAGWAAVRRWSRRPTAVLRLLVPAVVAVSLLPDIAMFFTAMQPNTTALGVIALMMMHVATAAVAVPLFAWALPLPTRR
ncbi:DUF6069 family protein [Nonomuraea guangzhouensis]|uniref:DUF6069 family protein n=1 Tax=Nonomuraea guangzhouensis TaxID=1291555 RepID=A0ABW4GUX9_9ACTN|nr:DUF6069 family protein [Nonomuraea guangzhouensis]